MRHVCWPAVGLAIAAAVACSESGVPPILGAGGTGGNGASCAYDRHDGASTAVPLELGITSAAAYLCPVGDRDFFSFDVPAGRPLVQVDIVYPPQASTPVELSYTVLDESGKVVSPGASDPLTTDNRSELHKRERLEPGRRYFLRVSDAGDEDADVVNGYTVTVSASEDSDNNEPNEDCAGATPLTTTETGAISSLGDRDAFAVTVPAGARIVDVTIQTDQASPVDLKATLSTGGDLLTTLSDPQGEDGPTLLHLRHGVIDAGTVCLLIEDDDAQQVDPDTLYTVSVQIAEEPDAQEQARRNDTPALATPVGASGGTLTGTIASLGDVDWYRVAVPAGRVLQVELDCPECAGIEPSISLVYPHADTGCDAGSSCEFLLGTRSCTQDAECTSGACREVPGGGKRCAIPCNEERNANLSCPGFECTATGSNTDACAAAAVCTGEAQCGALQYTRIARAGETGVRTAQPTIGAVTYVAVRDFRDDGFVASPYTLALTVYDDPDPNDRGTGNNFYYPYTDDAEFAPVLQRGVERATALARTADDPDGAGGAGPVAYTWSGAGCIGYETDVDLFRLEDSASPCGAGENCAMRLDFDQPDGPVKLGYSVVRGGADQRFSFAVDGEEDGTFGNRGCGAGEECAFYYATDDADYGVVVRSIGQDAWDPDPAHCYHFTVWVTTAPGCDASVCPLHPRGTLCGC